MKILGIETSCDDTGVAVLETKFPNKLKVLSNVVSSQVKLHAKYGGVYPTLAKREHQKNLPIVLKKALKEAKLLERDVDLIAVTVGPGLEPCLWVGVNFAKELAKKLKVPLVPADHMEGHILANFIGENLQFPSTNFQTLFPAIALAVSGGHTQLILMRDIGKYKILGETRDDAAGECFDKTARILGLPYPGGPAVAAEAVRYKIQDTRYTVKLPRPMMHQKNYDFSFSGLKTAVLYHQRNQPEKIKKSKQYIRAMAAEIQQAIIDVLIKKTIKASKDYKAKTIILGGGVSANSELRLQFQSAVTRHCEEGKTRRSNLSLIFPPTNLSTDNALMTAIAGYFHRNKKIARSDFAKLKAESNLRIDK